MGWVRWRRRRYQELAARGLTSHLAWDVAKAEARGRHRLARIIGKDAAQNAEFIAIGDTFALSGSNLGLSREQVDAIAKLND